MKDSNRLIAEFMDVFPRQGEERTGMKEFYSPIDLYTSGLPDELTLADDLDFEQWQWLMPVVEKIENIAIDEDVFYDVLMHGLECSIGHVCNAGQTKMEAVYKSVVEFIKQHNKNKKA